MTTAASLGSPPGELEALLWAMSLEHLAWFAAGDTAREPAGSANRILGVRVALDTSEGLRQTNQSLVHATWVLAGVTAALALATIVLALIDK